MLRSFNSLISRWIVVITVERSKDSQRLLALLDPLTPVYNKLGIQPHGYYYEISAFAASSTLSDSRQPKIPKIQHKRHSILYRIVMERNARLHTCGEPLHVPLQNALRCFWK